MHPSDARFGHPYQPYDIQHEFMTELYSCIDQAKVAIFESPTGTGKSLSLICGALTWLRDHERQLLNADHDPGNDDWLVQAEISIRRRELLQQRQEQERKLATIRDQEIRRIQHKADAPFAKKSRVSQQKLDQEQRGDDEFMLDDYDSDKEDDIVTTEEAACLSITTQTLLDKLHKPSAATVEEDEADRLKLIICSRTHSQLTQFVNELRRVKFPGVIHDASNDHTSTSCQEESVKHLPLGSRKNLCINPKVSQLHSIMAINEQCLELQKPGTPKDKKCVFLPTKDDKPKLDDFRDKAIALVRDIEDIGNLGRSMNICPYYASRRAIAGTEVLTLPYPLLLQKAAREALGVSVKNNVVIVDEAHNLMDAIAETHSVTLSLAQLDQAIRQTTAYAVRFKNRLKGKNRVYLTQVLRLLNSLSTCSREATMQTDKNEITVTAAQLMSGRGVDQIKPHKLLRYLYESKLAHKIEGYSIVQSEDDPKHTKDTNGVLMHFQNFLAVLMNPDDEGRFFLSHVDENIHIRYTLLDPREHFRDIVQEARSVILAGGTMSPMSDYADYLFSYLPKDRLRMFSFGHVIPESSLLAQAVVNGPSGVNFDFTYEKRGSKSMILELGRLLVQTCQRVPDGVVVFFPSYDYLQQVATIWRSLPVDAPLMASLAKLKTIFQDSKDTSVDDLLRKYANAIDAGDGGLMLSVVGGKLSEGINFSDRLGRAVVAVGLPFPNANSAGWKAKMQHVESLRYKQCKNMEQMSEHECKDQAKRAGREFYENACMRAVNQSIGRVIRHRNDFAAILMVDRRFATERIKRKLPGWIQGSIKPQGQDWVQIEQGLDSFFRDRLT